MANSRFHRAKGKRAERENLTGHGHINLVPLVDILTSIVFFSLLTYTGAVMMNLTAFDLKLPPVVVTADAAGANGGQRDTTTLTLAVKINDGKLRVEHSGNGAPFMREIPGTTGTSLDTLQALLVSIKQQFPDNNDVNVVPDDNVAYDDIVHVLDRIKAANLTGISFGSAARAQVATTAGPGRP